ncbi:hypothetical protein I5Q47_15620 [Serratia marcescens]|nr:hypothetical protein [Serratia marcescens]TPV63463.1 hypothetical protein FJ699_22240 [Serratia marcescens]HEJ9180344.1 hypothetical protein [Serratia marcescens]
MTVIQAPSRLCVYSNADRSGTLNFLNLIDAIVLKQHRNVTLDLSKVSFASAAASVLFFAIVSRAQFLLEDANYIRFKWPKKEDNPEGHRWIMGTGLAVALLAGNEEKLAKLTKEERFFQSAVEPFEHLIETVTMLQKQAVLNPEQFSLLASAISEAMLNVSHHAYEHQDFLSQMAILGGKRWWQCAWFDPEKNAVVFIICDLGLGIHRSFGALGGDLDKQNEVSSVQTALTLGQSRFVGLGRGNGSEDIKRPIGTGCAESETLLVLTGHARYRYNSNDAIPRCERLSEFIPGTLVEWSLVPRRGEDD